ncbi:hypothetical protein KXD93_06630 [Mucilaginibacter sp. BJC16-A38]|uniref:hypothetical protein n=1 Tax=Mucilaginibacter phenanthrenivorans TaxID=1234842 RepID=UPI002157D7D9|nr:hypothetical protein [Mucilaginibacter phenanthrenivorans]MCR8557308.1 hypothetical protein [Mucilaginibacter phenanthrenivorans]
MLTKPIYAVLLGVLLVSCSQSKHPALAPEYLYNAGDQKVISSLINNKHHTISIIYGNGPALRSAQDTVRTHTAGEQYVMVTWRQRPMPHWYGTNMNGKILAVETVTVAQDPAGKIGYSYLLKNTGGNNTIEPDVSREQRIQLITGQPAAVLPEN